jgi:hypothetical protein
MGYGHSSRQHTAKILRNSFDRALIVEIVDGHRAGLRARSRCRHSCRTPDGASATCGKDRDHLSRRSYNEPEHLSFMDKVLTDEGVEGARSGKAPASLSRPTVTP